MTYRHRIKLLLIVIMTIMFCATKTSAQGTDTDTYVPWYDKITWINSAISANVSLDNGDIIVIRGDLRFHGRMPAEFEMTYISSNDRLIKRLPVIVWLRNTGKNGGEKTVKKMVDGDFYLTFIANDSKQVFKGSIEIPQYNGFDMIEIEIDKLKLPVCSSGTCCMQF